MYRAGGRILVAVVLGVFLPGMPSVERVARAQELADAPPAPLTLTDPGALPFSETELQRALLARLLPSPAHPGPAAAIVEVAGPGAVSVRVGDQTRVVVIGDRTGTAAARVVALVVAELMSARASNSEASTGAAPAPPSEQARAAPGTDGPALAPLADAGRRGRRLSAAVGASKGAGSEELAAATLDASLVIPPGDGRWRLSPSAGMSFMPSRNAGTFDEVSFASAVVRLLAGAAWGPAELFVGPFASAYAIGGATTHRGFLFGGEAMARVVGPLSQTLRLAVEARVDGYANRVQVNWLGGAGYATPRVGVGIGLGLAWDWAS